ncbi:MAG: hypothetical protein H8D78_13860 [Chloroflexi bacterium]|nr:hypothetical protein [Chloroflexota bacterium]
MRRTCILSVFLLAVFLSACRAPTPTAVPTVEPTATPEAVITVTPPTATPSPAALPTATPTPVPTATPTPEPVAAMTPRWKPVIQVEPTFTPRPDDKRISIRDLPLGKPGHYVNVTFGYWLQYPTDWYTGFGNRPLLVSFSNLSPGAHNRNSMRAAGCLIEVNASPNIYGFTFEMLAAQLPRSFADVQQFELGGEPALHVRRGGEGPFDSEWGYVQHDERLFTLTLDYATDAGDVCLPAWENLLATWRWFDPELAAYRNTVYGYAISHPRRWFRFNPTEEGISISSQDPTDMTSRLEFMERAMVVETHVYQNYERLPLKEWLAAQVDDIDLTNDIPLEGIVGVRVLAEGPSPRIEEMSGFFQGPLGKIYMVACYYPVDQKWVFRPVANAIIYSFEF